MQLHEAEGVFEIGGGTIELVLHWSQVKMWSSAEIPIHEGFYDEWHQDSSANPRFDHKPNPWRLREEWLSLPEDRDSLMGFLPKAGYFVEEPRPEFTVAIKRWEDADVRPDPQYSSAMRKAVDKRYSPWNFALSRRHEEIWWTRRRFLRSWLSAGPNGSNELVADFPLQWQESMDRARAVFGWTRLGVPRVVLAVADAWQAMLATVHIDRLRGHRFRACARKGCYRLFDRVSKRGHSPRFCSPKCRNLHNVRKLRNSVARA